VTSLRQRLAAGAPVILDGGMGSMLLARGLAGGEAPERWNVDKPEQLEEVHRAYVDAGSEAIHTNTFGATPLRLAGFGLAERCRELNEAAVTIARRVGAPFVIGDVGPTGDYLPPVGKADPDAMRQTFLEQGRALASAGVDGLHIETMTDLREACIALEALAEAAPGVVLLASMTFDRKRRGFFTVMGDPLVATLRALADAGADAVGANCSITSGDMADLAAEAEAGLREAGVQIPLVAQANAGQPRMTAEGVTYDHDPEAFAADAARMVASGVRAVGGCCGTEPATVAALRRRLAAEPAT